MIEFSSSYYECPSSTNTLIKEKILEKFPEGTCVWADEQSGGYGRRGHAWASPKGGLYFSFILEPTKRNTRITQACFSQIPLVISLGVHAALFQVFQNSHIDARTKEALKIKWPNDIVLCKENALLKLAGMTCEAYEGAICVGIGINNKQDLSETLLNNDATRATHNIDAYKYAPVSLADLSASIDNEALLHLSLESIKAYYEKWLLFAPEGGLEPFKQEYETLMVGKGTQVVLYDDGGNIQEKGRLGGINRCGQIEIYANSGQKSVHSTSELHLAYI